MNRCTWWLAMLAVVWSQGARAGIDFVIESGRIELTATVVPPDGPPVTETLVVDATDLPGSAHAIASGASGTAEAFFELSLDFSWHALDVESYVFLFCDGAPGTQTAAHVRTIEPLVFRIFEELDFSEEGDFSIVPISGVVADGTMCPGTYALHIDRSIPLSENFFATDDAYWWLNLCDCLGPEVGFTGGSLDVTGQVELPDGTSDSSFVSGYIDELEFSVAGDTDGGLADGFASADGFLSDVGGGTYSLGLSASATATASAPGTIDSLFIGVFGDIRFELTKPKVLDATSSPPGVVSIVPVSGTVDGDTLSAGIYRLSFIRSATLGPTDLSDGESVAWTATLRPLPCNDADFAAPSNILDIADILAFLNAFDAQDPEADLAPPSGQFDVFDVIAFLAAFDAGCP